MSGQFAKRITVRTYKAAPIGDQQISDTTILIEADIEELQQDIGTGAGYEKRWRAAYEREARRICQALRESMPGGLFDALLVKMLDDKRCIFSVPLFTRTEEREKDKQEAFDLLASLIEDTANRSEVPDSPVWVQAERYCNRLRDKGMIRQRYIEDY